MQSDVKEHANASRPIKWTAGVDWYRFVVDRLEEIPLARERAEYIQWEDEQRAGKVKPWKFQGYDGYASESIRWGERGGKLLWESSGATAASGLARMGSFTGYSSRIDLQITLRLSSSQLDFATSSLKFPIPSTRPPIPPHRPSGLAVQSGGLWLGTVGRRTSPSYWRLYDKGVEARCAAPGELWRLELECKGQHSRTLACKQSEVLTQPTLCAQYLASLWKSQGYSWPYAPFTNEQLDTELVPAPPVTPLRLARWLRSSVAPTIPRLLTVYTVGEVLEMLNLSDVAVSTGRGDAHSNFAKHAADRGLRVAGERAIPRSHPVRMDATGHELQPVGLPIQSG